MSERAFDRKRLRLAIVAALCTATVATIGAGCRSKGGGANSTISADSSGAASLPPLAIRDDSKDLTFSFITTDGGFQLVHTVADVPYEARDVVRVWSEVSGDGIVGPWIYVADLRQALGDGTYKVDVMSREALEALAAKRRGRAKGSPPKSGEAEPTKGTGADSPKSGLVVTIYGASWCKPCHQVEAYLKSKNIAFIHKDIEEDDGADKEMRSKLKAAGLRGGSIPVIDVAGRILVGFSADELDQALAAAGH